MTPKSPAKTTQITKEQLPKWVSEAAKSNYNYAKKIAGRPLNQWPGQDVADNVEYDDGRVQAADEQRGGGRSIV
jgi:hypothetical protein